MCSLFNYISGDISCIKALETGLVQFSNRTVIVVEYSVHGGPI